MWYLLALHSCTFSYFLPYILSCFRILCNRVKGTTSDGMQMGMNILMHRWANVYQMPVLCKAFMGSKRGADVCYSFTQLLRSLLGL